MVIDRELLIYAMLGWDLGVIAGLLITIIIVIRWLRED